MPPRPISIRTCKCGCRLDFTPKRSDQIYLNKQHADFACNLRRKERDAQKTEQVKTLAKNDRILERYFIVGRGKQLEVIVFLDILLADGFDLSAHVGVCEKNDIHYYFTFRYAYCLSEREPIKVKIFKR
jgi:hypothetical protein